MAWILYSELFPARVRGAASSVTAVLRAAALFVSIKSFPALLATCGIGGSFLVSGGVCLLALAVAALIVPETRGLTSQQLEDIYKEVSKKLSSLCLDKCNVWCVHKMPTNWLKSACHAKNL